MSEQVDSLVNERLGELYTTNDWMEREIAKVGRQPASAARDTRKNQLLHELQEVIDEIERLEAGRQINER